MKTLAIGIAAAAAFMLVGCDRDDDRRDNGDSATVKTEERSLTLVPPGDVTVARGGTAQIEVKLKRDNFPDPVKLKFGNMPDDVDVMGVGGVNVEAGPVNVEVGNETPAITGDSATFTIRAEDDAELVNDYVVNLTANGPGGRTVTTSFKITVKQPG